MFKYTPLILLSFATIAVADNLQTGLSEHFVSFLNESIYESYGFNRSGIIGGSFGGKLSDDDVIIN